MRDMPYSWVPVTMIVVGGLWALFGFQMDRFGIGYPGFGLGQALWVAAGGVLSAAGLALRVPASRVLLRSRTVSRLILSLCSIGATVLAVEAALRWQEKVAARKLASSNVVLDRDVSGLLMPVADEKLGLRLAPHTQGHDANGFRNVRAPDQADIVAIGDSQTWGINAQRAEAWPQVLAGLLHCSTYNMALGYYGPIQYWALLEDALKLTPHVIVVGLYFGNDIWGAYQFAYTNSHYAQYRDADVVECLAVDTIGPRAKKLAEEWAGFALPDGDTGTSQVGAGCVAHFALGRLLVRSGLWRDHSVPSADYCRLKAWAETFPEHGVVYERGAVRTILTVGYRQLAQDLTEPRIRERLRLTLLALDRMAQASRQAGVHLGVLLIPTKELVYAEAIRSRTQSMPASYRRLIADETETRNRIMAGCRAAGIVTIDPLDALRAAVARNETLYRVDVDGHFLPRGYYLLASVVRDALRAEIPVTLQAGTAR